MSTTIKTEPFPPIHFTAFVKRDPENKLSGKCAGRITPEGLVITPPGQPPIVAAPGTDVKYLGENRIAVPMPDGGRNVHFSVVRRFGYQNNLALDIVAFLAGDIGKLNPNDYRIARWLFLAPLLPFTILAFLYWYGSTYQPTQFAKWGLEVQAVAGGLCLLLAILCLFIVLMESTKAVVRVLACICITGLGLLVAGWWLEAIKLPRWFDEPIDEATGVLKPPKEFDWKTVHYQGPNFKLNLPAESKPKGKRTVPLAEDRQLELAQFTCTDHKFDAEYQIEYGLIPEPDRATFFDNVTWMKELFMKDFPEATEVKLEETNPFRQVFRDGKPILLKEIRGNLPNGRRVWRQIHAPSDYAVIMTITYKPTDENKHFVRAFFDDVRFEGFNMMILQDANPAGGRPGGGGGGRPGGGGRASGATLPTPTGGRGMGGGRGGFFGGRRNPGTPTASGPTTPAPTAPAPTASAPSGN